MKGAVAAGHPLTAEAGARVLAEGGNAVDACVAAALAAFAAEGPLTGPAGGGFFLVFEGGRAALYDCFFTVPTRALGEMEEVVIDFADASTQSFHVGEGSVAVPGLVVGLEAAHRGFGSLPWAELVEPAIELAGTGVQPTEGQRFLHEILAAILLRTEAGRRVYGDLALVHTQELAQALEAIRDEGAAAVPALLPELADDLASYRVIEREPVTTSFLGRVVAATPSPSRGGGVVTRVLAVLDHGGGSERIDRLVRALHAGYEGHDPAVARPTGTTHISVVDAEGNAAALSSTLGSGSGVFRAGFQLNNMLGELDVIGEEAREPRERLPSMMTPTLVLEDGRPRLVLGSAGSVRLAGAIAQVLANVIELEMPVEQAIAAPRVHVEGGRVHLEGGHDERAAQHLAAEGWEVVSWSGRNLYFGGVSAVEVRADGALAAAGDPRRGGHGVVVG